MAIDIDAAWRTWHETVHGELPAGGPSDLWVAGFIAGRDATIQAGITAARESGRLMPSAWLALEAQGATEEDLFGTERLDAQP